MRRGDYISIHHSFRCLEERGKRSLYSPRRLGGTNSSQRHMLERKERHRNVTLFRSLLAAVRDQNGRVILTYLILAAKYLRAREHCRGPRSVLLKGGVFMREMFATLPHILLPRDSGNTNSSAHSSRPKIKRCSPCIYA